MSSFTQENRLLSLATPLGADALLLAGFAGREELSRLFSYRLDVLSDRGDVTARDLVGKNVSWCVRHSEREPRHFNGYVSRFSAAGRGLYDLHAYRLEVVPWLWFLTRTTDSRIFFPDVPDKTVKDVLREVFADYPFAEFNLDNLGGDYPEHEYWVQYRESAFNFVSRLLEDAGVFYFWVHEEGKHTLLLGDRKSHYRDCPEKHVPFSGGGSRAAAQISRWQHDWECRSGKVAHTDYNFETPKTSLLSGVSTVVDLPDAAGFELFDYPGDHQDKDGGVWRIKRRMEEEEAGFHVVHGDGNCCTFHPGGKFTLTEHDNAESNKTYALTAVEHRGCDTTYGTEGESSYENKFTAIPDSVVYRPARLTRRPFVQGVQTAVVVGPPTEEIHTDQDGRIKVQFHWDRRGKRDEHSSCWIRVATMAAGGGWGMFHLPRIGQEVIVEFLEGDPSRPLVTGSVYNANQMPPFSLPGAKRTTGMKSHTSPGGGGFNELSFDDSKGKEKITLHGQYDMSTTILHDDAQAVKNNRTVTVNGTLTERIQKDTSITIVEGKLVHDVAANTASYHVQGDLVEVYDANQTTTVQKTIAMQSAQADVYIEAATKIALVVGKSSLVMDADGNINLTGVNIVLNGSDSVGLDGAKIALSGGSCATMGVGGQSVTCDQSKVAVSGAGVNASAVGIHEITGAVVKIN